MQVFNNDEWSHEFLDSPASRTLQDQIRNFMVQMHNQGCSIRDLAHAVNHFVFEQELDMVLEKRYETDTETA